MPPQDTQQKTLRSINGFIGDGILSTDGEIGKCVDFIFDDERWTIRYLVADTRKWLPGRHVLISPYQFGTPELGAEVKTFRVNLTKESIKDAPPLDSSAPISRLYELEMARFYKYPPYWVGADLWGGRDAPSLGGVAHTPEELERHAEELREIEQHRLRSVNEVSKYQIAALDGEIGHVEDFVVDTLSWSVRWIVIDIKKWLPGRKVLVSPEWIKEVDWKNNSVSVDLLKQQVKDSPDYDPGAPVNRDYEGRLHDFYGKPVYWT